MQASGPDREATSRILKERQPPGASSAEDVADLIVFPVRHSRAR